MSNEVIIKDAVKRMNSSPIGSCALAGTTYPIDRAMTASLLGFDSYTASTLDGVADRDFCIELASALSICMVHLSRLCEEIILWCSWEFKFVELDDAFSTGSSIMPQKKNPDVAGLNLDYIRYPVTDASEDSGYTMAAMEGFYTLKGKEFSEAQKKDREKMAKKFLQLFNADYLEGGQAEADQNYNDWCAYRANIITEYVRRIKMEIKDTQKIVLSTSVFASLTESLGAKKQDWKTWFSNGWIDIATPMAYYTAASDVLSNVTAMIQTAGNNCYYYSGLASSYSGLPAWQNKEQIEASYLAGANGYVIFCSTQIIGHADVQDVLMAGVNSTAAVRPHDTLDKVLEGYFASVLDRGQRVYMPAGGMTQEQYDQLSAKFEEIKAMPQDGAVNIYKIQKAVQGINVSTYAKGYSGQRITESLKELTALLDTRISISLIANGDWDPEKQPARPVVTEDGIKEPEQTKPGTSVKPGNKPGNDNKPGASSNGGVNVGKLIPIIVIGIALIAISAMLAMVLTSVGLPVEGIALVAGVDRIFDMGRTVLNITGDASCAVIVSNLERRKTNK